jgi:hypothetical protein
VRPGALASDVAARLRELTRIYGRLPEPEEELRHGA